MNDMRVDCEACGWSDICKSENIKREQCILHKDIEHQY